MKSYKGQICTISSQKCNITKSCISCEIAQSEERHTENEKYEFELDTISKNNHSYDCNVALTILRTTPDKINQVIEDFKLDLYLEFSEITDDYLEKYYPDWLKTREIHNLINPQKYILGNELVPLIIVFDDYVYGVAPLACYGE